MRLLRNFFLVSFLLLLILFFISFLGGIKQIPKEVRKKESETLHYKFLANKKPALLSAKRACKGGIIMKKIVYCFALHELNNK